MKRVAIDCHMDSLIQSAWDRLLLTFVLHGVFSAALNAGGPLGIVLYYCLASTLESWFGWRGSLRVAGLAALPWLLLWQKMEVDPPQVKAHKGIYYS